MDRPIIITGFMASGKTTIAKALANLLNCPYIDLDQMVTARTGRTPRQIIEESGEAAFRNMESAVLLEALYGPDGVIALGGGAWLDEGNRLAIERRNTTTVWIDAPFDVCWERIEASGATRPLARDQERAKELFDQRLPIYKLASVRVATHRGQEAREVALKIIEVLRSPSSIS